MVRFLTASYVFLSCCSLVLANTFCLSVSACVFCPCSASAVSLYSTLAGIPGEHLQGLRAQEPTGIQQVRKSRKGERWCIMAE